MMTVDEALVCADEQSQMAFACPVLAAEVRRLRDEVNGLTGSLERAESVLQNLMSFLSVNGCRADVDPENAELRIRDGIDMLVRPMLERAERAEKALKEAQEPVAWQCPEYGDFSRVERIGWTPLCARPVPAAPALPYLCNGTRFKISINGEGGTYCFDGYPELDGKWVALVDAADNRHMQSPAVAVPAVPDEWAGKWRHKSGRIYRVIAVANTAATDYRYPLTIVYQGDDGRTWSRLASDWHGSMTRALLQSAPQPTTGDE